MSLAASSKQPPEVIPGYPAGGVPSTPLEARLGPHPKKDHLIWKTPPSRQLGREKRNEYQLDVTERFYDDYIGGRATGDARNEVMTGSTMHKLGYNPEVYRLNALQNLAYDPSRPVPKQVDLNHMVRMETARKQEHAQTHMRQRRMSDSMLLHKPQIDYSQHGSRVAQLEPINLSQPLVSSGLGYPERPTTAMQKELGLSVKSDIIPGIEKWMTTASGKDRNAAEKFLRTISSQGKRPDPATMASKHPGRVRSAVMTPSRQQRQQKDINDEYRQLERSTKGPAYMAPAKQPGAVGGQRKLKRSNSDAGTGARGMFAGTRQPTSHFTVHPEWASEESHK